MFFFNFLIYFIKYKQHRQLCTPHRAEQTIYQTNMLLPLFSFSLSLLIYALQRVLSWILRVFPTTSTHSPEATSITHGTCK